MRGLTNGLRRFFSNKNTVTIIGVFLGIAVLYFGYQWRIKQATNPVTMPVAKETIQPRTRITSDMVTYVSVPPALLKGDYIDNAKNVIGKYSNYNAVIPEGSLFYGGTLIEYAELPDVGLLDIPEGEVAYNFKVDMNSSYGNSLMPNSYVDIYFKAIDETGSIIFGKLVANVKILAVKDKNGQHVFENNEENRTPAILIFSVPEDIHLILRKAEYMEAYSAELIPVPTSETYAISPGAIELKSAYLKSYIDSKSVYIPADTTNTTTGQ
jgi:pilus assembly protein CpaB